MHLTSATYWPNHLNSELSVLFADEKCGED